MVLNQKDGANQPINLKAPIKKIVFVVIFMAVLPLILSTFAGTDVIKRCPTHTHADFMIAESDPDTTITSDMVGQCITNNNIEESQQTATSYVADMFVVIELVLFLVLLAVVAITVGKY